jgi:hypothetical protein
VFNTDPGSVGIRATPDLPRVWGATLDQTYPKGSVTVVGLADGTTSMYTSGGGGVIGGAAHGAVVAATNDWLRRAEQLLDLLPPDSGTGLPPAGSVTLRALTYAGPRSVTASEEDFGYGRHPASGLFHATHRVITELRLLDEKRP